jgi:hypothetical protein
MENKQKKAWNYWWWWICVAVALSYPIGMIIASIRDLF